MKGPTSDTVDRLIQEYRINIDSTTPVKLKKAKAAQTTRVFEVSNVAAPTFIIDTPMARDVACYPHLVGTPLSEVARAAAAEALPIMLELSGLSGTEGEFTVVFEQILRAAPGYMLQEVAPDVLGNDYRTVYIRPRYTHKSYRDHDGTVQRAIEIVHQNFSEFPNGKRIVLITQDTVASGRSAEVSISATLEHCERSGCKIEKWVLYGFISEYGLNLLARIAHEKGIPIFAFAMGNLTALSTNDYDMPLYGADEAYWQKIHSIRKLGSTIDRSSLDDYLPCIVPGSDQPGDWSARQTRLFNGSSYEPSDIMGHLNNSIRLITSLSEIGSFEPWQQDIAEKELGLLQRTLEEETFGSHTGKR